jgi:AraC-like DNA-binding protein
MNAAALPKNDKDLSKMTTREAKVISSAEYNWRGTLVLDIMDAPTGECRHDHARVALQQWLQPLCVRSLLEPSTWRTIEPGARLWLPGEKQYFEWRQGGRTHVVLIKPERIEEILERPFAEVDLERWRGLDFQSPVISRLVNTMVDDVNNGCPAGPLVGDSLTTALVGYLEAGPSYLALAESRPGPPPKSFERALQYIEDNLAERPRMADLAKEAGCSPKQLSRAFRERHGVLPHQYLLERRVERASTLIEEGRLTLAEVAIAVGFADQSQMTKAFQKLIGTTPGRYRKRVHDWVRSTVPPVMPASPVDE